MMKRTLVLFLFGSLSVTARAEDPSRRWRTVAALGDEIVVCGQLYHTTAKVVLWTDPGGFDAYRVEPRFGPIDYKPTAEEREKSEVWSARYNGRDRGLPKAERERGAGGYDLPKLKDVVDQFVLHYDVAGTAKNCFEVLQDKRGLSVHFMLDVDGTIYQSLDLKERAWHATKANSRSIGIEIANIGALSRGRYKRVFEVVSNRRRRQDSSRRSRRGKVVAVYLGRGATARASTSRWSEWYRGSGYSNTTSLRSSMTPSIKLTATLCSVFPKIRCDYPRDAAGKLVTHRLRT